MTIVVLFFEDDFTISEEICKIAKCNKDSIEIISKGVPTLVSSEVLYKPIGSGRKAMCNILHRKQGYKYLENEIHSGIAKIFSNIYPQKDEN